MLLEIKHQDSYSRGQLLLRSIFGMIYIVLPHIIVFSVVQIWGGILAFLAWWAILFTGSYPQSWFEFQVGMRRWMYRLSATTNNLVDGYPAVGPSGTSEVVFVDIPYPETLSRGLLIVKAMFGAFYVGIPHGFCLYFRMIATGFLSFLSWWAVLFTGNYPQGWHEFNVGTLRWMLRMDMYMSNLSDDYPPFSGKE